MNNIAHAYEQTDYNDNLFRGPMRNIASQVMQEGFLLLAQDQYAIILQKRGEKFSRYWKCYTKNLALEGLTRLLNED